MRRLRTLFGLVGVALGIAAGCTHDFNKFDLTGDGGVRATGGTAATGTGGLGATGGTTTTGGTGTTGGASTGGAGGAGATAGSGAVGGSGGVGCTAIEKRCAGVCVSLDSPATGCKAAACDPCPTLPNTTAACATDGTCGVGSCATNWGDCNNKPIDGCEQQTLTDTTHCGACNRSCSTSGVMSAECAAGKCTSSCTLGRSNCIQPAATGADDGCETTTSTLRAQCGSCTNDCSRQGLGACANSLCTCNGRNNCGSGSSVNCTGGLCVCNGTACAHGETCNQAGTAKCACNGGAACAAGQVCCQTPAGCKDIATDASSCGACGRACTTGFVCNAGACACNTNSDCGGVDSGTGGTTSTGGTAGSGPGGAGGSVATGGTAGAGGAGVPSTGFFCVSGRCVCNGKAPCAEGQRCTASGTCG